MRTRALWTAAALGCVLASAGCSNPDAAPSTAGGARAVALDGAGEPPAPAAARPGGQSPRDPRASPGEALQAFAALYVNWSYRDLTAHQRLLAAMSVGSARYAERQAAASSAGDEVISGAKIENSGRVIALARDAARRGRWVIVTLERTSGGGEYRGLPAGYHVTLARVAEVHGGYAVSEWLPQS